MPKMKSHSGAKKRFSTTGSGKVKRSQQNARHLLTDKPAKRKMQLRKGTTVSPTQERTIKRLIQE
jgi:large subunit ribosomal protein L35